MENEWSREFFKESYFFREQLLQTPLLLMLLTSLPYLAYDYLFYTIRNSGLGVRCSGDDDDEGKETDSVRERQTESEGVGGNRKTPQ